MWITCRASIAPFMIFYFILHVYWKEWYFSREFYNANLAANSSKMRRFHKFFGNFKKCLQCALQNFLLWLQASLNCGKAEHITDNSFQVKMDVSHKAWIYMSHTHMFHISHTAFSFLLLLLLQCIGCGIKSEFSIWYALR